MARQTALSRHAYYLYFLSLPQGTIRFLGLLCDCYVDPHRFCLIQFNRSIARSERLGRHFQLTRAKSENKTFAQLGHQRDLRSPAVGREPLTNFTTGSQTRLIAIK